MRKGVLLCVRAVELTTCDSRPRAHGKQEVCRTTFPFFASVQVCGTCNYSLHFRSHFAVVRFLSAFWLVAVLYDHRRRGLAGPHSAASLTMVTSPPMTDRLPACALGYGDVGTCATTTLFFRRRVTSDGWPSAPRTHHSGGLRGEAQLSRFAWAE